MMTPSTRSKTPTYIYLVMFVVGSDNIRPQKNNAIWCKQRVTCSFYIQIHQVPYREFTPKIILIIVLDISCKQAAVICTPLLQFYDARDIQEVFSPKLYTIKTRLQSEKYNKLDEKNTKYMEVFAMINFKYFSLKELE